MKLSICLFILFLFGFQQTQSCSCELRHPQHLFCDADYAVKVFVKSVRMVEVDKIGNVEEWKIKTDKHGYADFSTDPGKELKTEMKVRILKVFKGDVNKYKTTTIYTTGPFNSCERILDPLRTYFLMGSIHAHGLLHVLMCDYVLDVSNEQASTIRHLTRNFKLRFPLGCTGKCHVCRYLHCYQDKDVKSVCQWPNYADMYDTLEASQYSCVPNKKKICKLRKPKQIIDHGGLGDDNGVIIDEGGLGGPFNGGLGDYNGVIIDEGGLGGPFNGSLGDYNGVIIDEGGLGGPFNGSLGDYNGVIIDEGSLFGTPFNGSLGDYNGVFIDEGGLGGPFNGSLGDYNGEIIDEGGLGGPFNGSLGDYNGVLIDEGGLGGPFNGSLGDDLNDNIVEIGVGPGLFRNRPVLKQDDHGVIIDEGGLGGPFNGGLGDDLNDFKFEHGVGPYRPFRNRPVLKQEEP